MKCVAATVLGLLSVIWPLAAFAGENSRPVASVENEGAFLYLGGKNEFFLKYHGATATFSWDYDAHSGRPPQMKVFDYDGDGEKEAAVSLCVGTGTGLSLEELHVVKFNGEKLTAHTYRTDDYLRQVKESVGLKISEENGGLSATFSSPPDSIRIDLSGYLSEDSPKPADMKLECGDVIYFSLGDSGLIEFKAALGLKVDNPFSPDYFVDLTAGVRFNDGVFSLADFKIVKGDD